MLLSDPICSYNERLVMFACHNRARKIASVVFDLGTCIYKCTPLGGHVRLHKGTGDYAGASFKFLDSLGTKVWN
jgi:hypothetical protein